MLSSVRRPVAAVVLASSLVVVAASCSGSDDESSSSAIEIEPSSYVVREAVTTTVAAPVDSTPTADGRSPVEQAYTVEDGDVPFAIAELYEVDLDELRNYNGWASDYSDFPGTGGVVRIPPNAKFIDPNATTTSAAEDETEDTEEGSETTAAAQDGDCAPGSYAVEDGDNPTLIAEKFDVTLEALTAANGWDASYSNFPGSGESIVIPAPADCDATATT